MWESTGAGWPFPFVSNIIAEQSLAVAGHASRKKKTKRLNVDSVSHKVNLICFLTQKVGFGFHVKRHISLLQLSE